MKFESYEEYIVDRLKRLSKEYPDTIYYLAERDDYEGETDYFCKKENKESFSDEESDFLNEDYLNDTDIRIPYTLCLDQDTVAIIDDRDMVFKFKNGIVYSPKEEI